MCASLVPDNDSFPGKLVLNCTITLRDTWAKEAQKALVSWMLIAAAKVLHGVLRVSLLNRRVGDHRAVRLESSPAPRSS